MADEVLCNFEAVYWYVAKGVARAEKNMRRNARDHFGGNIIRQYSAQHRWLKAAAEEVGPWSGVVCRFRYAGRDNVASRHSVRWAGVRVA